MMPMFKEREGDGYYCIFEISKVPLKYIEPYFGFEATHVFATIKSDGSFNYGSKPMRINGNLNKLIKASNKKSDEGCINSILANIFYCYYCRRPPIFRVERIIKGMGVRK